MSIIDRLRKLLARPDLPSGPQQCHSLLDQQSDKGSDEIIKARARMQMLEDQMTIVTRGKYKPADWD